MQSPRDDNPERKNNRQLPMEERVEVALLLLKNLNPLQEKADAEGFSFLAYLLRMAVLEAQAIATQSVAEPQGGSGEIDDSSYAISPQSEFDNSTYECSC